MLRSRIRDKWKVYSKPKWVIGVLVIVLALVLGACAAPEEAAEPDAGEPVEQVEEAAPEEPMRDEAVETTAEQREMRQAQVEQKLILNGNIEIAVEDAEETRLEIRSYVREIGGYVENSNFRTHNDDSLEGYMTIRVPQEKFNEAMDTVETLGDVRSRSTSSEDVTMEYVDMEARLNNLKRQEARYLDILEEAENVEEIMEVEERLRDVRGEIETMTARLENLEAQVNYSTIDVSISEDRPVKAQVEADGFEGLWNRMGSAFTTSINTLINGVTNLAVFISGAFPYLVVIGIVGGGVYKIRNSLGIKFRKKSGEETDEL